LISDGYRSQIIEDAACSVCYAALVFALSKGIKIRQKIHIGQGFKGKSGDGVGIGNCACGFKTSLKGCPPKAVDIVEFLGGKGTSNKLSL